MEDNDMKKTAEIIPSRWLAMKGRRVADTYLQRISSATFLKTFFWQYWGLTQGFMLARQLLYNLSHFSSPFCVGYV
jgi:hypothetical protein